MSRPKSEATLDKERDRAIRKERREMKRQAREVRIKEREHRRAVHESIQKNGIPRVKSGEQYLGLRDAIAYSPLVLCGGCAVAVRESDVIGDRCAKCHYTKEVMQSDNQDSLKAQEGRAVPGKGDGGTKSDALVG